MISCFKVNLSLKKHGFSITELDDMMPFERDAYFLLIEQEINEKNSKNKNNKAFDIG